MTAETFLYYSELFNSISPILNMVFAVLNIVIAYFLFKETRRLREAETFPDIIISLEKNNKIDFFYDIVVRNVGKGSARKLKFIFDPNDELINLEDNNFNRLGFFKGVVFFAPNQEYRSFFGGHELFKEPKHKPFQITVTYQNNKKGKFRNDYIIDPSIYSSTSIFPSKTADDYYPEVKKIREEISEIRKIMKKS